MTISAVFVVMLILTIISTVTAIAAAVVMEWRDM